MEFNLNDPWRGTSIHPDGGRYDLSCSLVEEGTSRRTSTSSLGSPCSNPPNLPPYLLDADFIDLIMAYRHDWLLSSRDLTLTCGFTKVSVREQGT